MLMALRYAHTLVFACPDCRRDISVRRDHSNIEAFAALNFHMQCLTCQKIVNLPGYFAKTHSVIESNGIAGE
jgi:uncharacterized protein YbaR (Trm112 family)